MISCLLAMVTQSYISAWRGSRFEASYSDIIFYVVRLNPIFKIPKRVFQNFKIMRNNSYIEWLHLSVYIVFCVITCISLSRRGTHQCVVEFHLNLLIASMSFLQDFLVILKQRLQNYQTILNKCFLVTSSSKQIKQLCGCIITTRPELFLSRSYDNDS